MHCELLIAAALWASGQAAPAPAPPPFDVPPAKVLQMQYAQAKLLLAETNLIRIEQMNRRLARSVPSSVVAEFKSDVDEARLQVEQAASATAACVRLVRKATLSGPAAWTRLTASPSMSGARCARPIVSFHRDNSRAALVR